ncbi:MAG: NAD(P)/FAD-dependent oxidoreductase, partial [Verrucomicrobia bacterium]|nr:NAD(P)/FAD-dependent oxidoreductase [Verrucomicrobiota bacterium]
LGVTPLIDRLPSAKLRWVEFVDLAGRSIRFDLLDQTRGELGIRRKHFDQALIRHAISMGAEVRFGNPVLRVENGADWKVTTNGETVQAKFLVAADGRNSSVARLLKEYPKTATDRVGLQTHFSAETESHVRLQLRRFGYLGLANIGEGLTNLCLVCRPRDAEQFRQEATEMFGLTSEHRWQSITPLTRPAIQAQHANLLYIGDAARVVEPLTGEGIFYALQSGALAAEAILNAKTDPSGLAVLYARRHGQLYRHRLWVNQLARLAVLHPRISNLFLGLLRLNPAPLKYLTSKVVRD